MAFRVRVLILNTLMNSPKYASKLLQPLPPPRPPSSRRAPITLTSSAAAAARGARRSGGLGLAFDHCCVRERERGIGGHVQIMSAKFSGLSTPLPLPKPSKLPSFGQILGNPLSLSADVICTWPQERGGGKKVTNGSPERIICFPSCFLIRNETKRNESSKLPACCLRS